MNEMNITVAISSDFLSAFASIPAKQQNKVLNFVNKFRSDPTMPGLNYERIKGARDPHFRSVRIDDSYRGVIFKPDTGNVYMLLWVDTHDNAYAWAKNKVCHIHPETGSLQVYDVVVAHGEGQGDLQPEGPALFQAISERHLKRFGVPEELIPLVRSFQSQEELERASESLPQEAYEALFFLAEGFTVDEVAQDMEMAAPKRVDTEDYAKALEKPESKQRFYVVDDELELAAILHAPLEKWRVFLHPSQRAMVEKRWKGPVRVLGGAGTGKTVAALHRAKWLAQHIFTKPDDRVLFTTFTRNLAADIQNNLRSICSKDVLRRIEVVNLDRWVSDFLRRNGYKYEIDYGERGRELWSRSLDIAPGEMDLDESFFRDEWERVIQPQGITSKQEYLKASRVGRGVPLSRKARLQIWPMFEEYRTLMNELGLKEPDDAMRDARHLILSGNAPVGYKAVVVDEAQDMGAQAFLLLRQLVRERENDLFIVGDAHQRIYRHKVVLGQCGIRIVGRSKKLKVNYRTTDETRKWAVGLLQGVSVDDLDGALDDQRGYTSLLHGAAPVVRRYASFQAEVAGIASFLKQEVGEESWKSTCLAARTHSLLKQYESALHENDLPTYWVRRNQADDRQASGLRLATMHRVKGLEFDRVIVAGVNDGTVPLAKALTESTDPSIRKESEIKERALLYVAATRARRELLVTCFGKPSSFITLFFGRRAT